MKPDTRVLDVRPASLDQIKKGDYVGLTSIDAGGKRIAIEADSSPRTCAGASEGHVPWDLIKEPNTMTNATVAEVESVGAQHELKVNYKQGQGDQQTAGSAEPSTCRTICRWCASKAPDRRCWQRARPPSWCSGTRPTAAARRSRWSWVWTAPRRRCETGHEALIPEGRVLARIVLEGHRVRFRAAGSPAAFGGTSSIVGAARALDRRRRRGGARPAQVVVLQRPLAHEPHPFGQDAIDDQLGVVGRAEIVAQQRVGLQISRSSAPSVTTSARPEIRSWS